jgi:hypothetical protein
MHQLQTNKQTATLSANFRPFGRFCQTFEAYISFLQDLLEFYVELLGTKPLRKKIEKSFSNQPFFSGAKILHTSAK